MKIDDVRNGAVRIRYVDPTATQNRLDTHDTPSSEPDCARPITGASATRHCEPFQRSITGAVRPGRPAIDPTATQNVLDVQDSELIAPVGAACCNDHLPPLHASASAPFGPVPTATQNLEEVHDTAASCPVGIGGAGTASIVQFAADAPSTQPRPTATIEPKKSTKADRRTDIFDPMCAHSNQPAGRASPRPKPTAEHTRTQPLPDACTNSRIDLGGPKSVQAAVAVSALKYG